MLKIMHFYCPKSPKFMHFSVSMSEFPLGNTIYRKIFSYPVGGRGVVKPIWDNVPKYGYFYAGLT